MDLGSLLILLAIFLAAVLYLVRPFFSEGDSPLQLQAGASSLLAEKERLLTAIEDLEQEFWLDRIPEKDYRRKREYLLKTTAGVLQEIELLQQDFPQAEKTREDEDDRIEEESLEAMIEARRKKLHQQPRGTCPSCGADVYRGDQFCGRCGEAL